MKTSRKEEEKGERRIGGRKEAVNLSDTIRV